MNPGMSPENVMEIVLSISSKGEFDESPGLGQGDKARPLVREVSFFWIDGIVWFW